MKKTIYLVSALLLLLAAPALASAAGSGGDGHGGLSIVFLMFAIVLFSGKLGGIVERFGLPGVLGELAAGIVLSAVAMFGASILLDLRQNEIMAFMAEFGAVLLLFKIGLESNISKLSKVGANAIMVAVVGVALPFLAGTYLLGPLLFSEASAIAHMFLGAALVATSVGITASVFSDCKSLALKPCQTVLGAAVIDDVLGLFVLAIVSAIAATGSITMTELGILSLKAFGFLIGAIVIGQLSATHVSNMLAKIQTGTGMKISVAVVVALLYAYLASVAGLAPIIGAFCAGLILDAVNFKSFAEPDVVHDLQKLAKEQPEVGVKIQNIIDKHSHTHIEDLISTLGFVFIPIFFVFTGLQIDFATLLNPALYGYALIIGIVAVLTKLVAGFVSSGSLIEKLLIGASMVPRGEVGLIFAAVGKASGVLNNELFSVIVLVIIFTTFIAPPFVKRLVLVYKESDENVVIKPRLRFLQIRR